MASNVYRIAQEAVTNAIKHGRADNLRIGLLAHDHEITLEVVDNGGGFDLSSRDTGKKTGMGLRTMEYRASLIGGSLRIERLTPRGTLVRCVFPRPSSLTPFTPPSTDSRSS